TKKPQKDTLRTARGAFICFLELTARLIRHTATRYSTTRYGGNRRRSPSDAAVELRREFPYVSRKHRRYVCSPVRHASLCGRTHEPVVGSPDGVSRWNMIIYEGPDANTRPDQVAVCAANLVLVRCPSLHP